MIRITGYGVDDSPPSWNLIQQTHTGPYVAMGGTVLGYRVDTRGGNSGSACINNKGELVGLAFDGNYEAMASDWIFLPEISRSIQVDIRYVLWLMDAVDKADHLITEMGLTPSID